MSAITKKHYRNLFVVTICLTTLFTTSSCFAREGEFQINCPYWEIYFDRAGYIDLATWYDSERHNSPGLCHEMMTGDWAAAVWYQGINEGIKGVRHLFCIGGN